jgi:cytochrome c biogenesis factor
MEAIAVANNLTEVQRTAIAKSNEDNKLLTTLAALVPADVLAAHAFVLSLTTKTVSETSTEITEPFWLKWLFVGLVLITPILYLLGTKEPKPSRKDLIRMVIPMLAFVTWAALLGTSGLTPWIGNTVPHVAIAGAAVVVAVLIIAMNARLTRKEA